MKQQVVSGVRRRALVGAGAAALAVAGAGAGLLRPLHAQARRRVTVALSGRGAPMHLPILVASQMGYFAQEGLEVEFWELPVQSRVRLAMSGGNGPLPDMACAPFEQVLLLQASGRAVRSLVAEGRAPQRVLGVSARSLPSFRGVPDLTGRRIGITEPGSTEHLVAAGFLARAGLSPAQVNFVPVGTPGVALQALRSGELDGLCHVDPTMTQLEQRGEIRVLADTRTLRGTAQALGGDMVSTCLYTSEEFLGEHADLCRSMVYAVVHALKWLQSAGPSDLIRTVPEAYFGGDRALYLAAVGRSREALSPDGLVSLPAVRNAMNLLASFEPDFRAERVQLDRCFTNDLARLAKQRYNA